MARTRAEGRAAREVFSQNLRVLMAIGDTRQKDLIKALGFSQKLCSFYCGGVTLPREDNMIAIAAYFGVTPDYMLQRHSWQ